MKLKNIFKKAAAMVMAAVTVLSLLPATAFAATGNVGTITFTRTYDAGGNIMYYNSGADINGYHAGGTGAIKYRMYVDGNTAFCIQPGVPLHTGNTLTESSSATWNALSASQKKAVGLALLYGYQGNRGNLTGSDDEIWMATQTLVWEFVTGCRNSTGSFTQTDTTVYSLHFGSSYPNSGAAAAYDQIVSLLNRHTTVPSFMNGGSRELEYKDGAYTLTLTDSNGVLFEYSLTSSDGRVRISKSGNTLTLTSSEALDGSVRITATRSNIPTVSESARMIAYGDDSLQDVVIGVENTDPVTASLNIETPTGNLTLKKTSEDGVVSGIHFNNNLIHGEIHGLKKDDSGNPLGGALIGLFHADCTEFTTENVLVTATSAEDGSFSFAQVPYGNWLVREIEAPTGYVLSEEAYPVTIDADGAVVEVEIENTLIRGTVQLTKVDEDYPDNKLTGAEFEIYRDANGDEKLDGEDERLGTLTEVSTGVYEMSELTYGGYFVKETKAPEGFYLDENAYYFAITEHGKTVTVENDAGKGCFINQAQKGSLRIVKTSSDGKVEGFSFRVTGEGGYEQVFTTDKKGEILIEGLRIGEYTVSEVSDNISQNYVLPAAATVTIKAEKTATVTMHNELRDTPKTGDSSNPTLWLALMGVATVGAAACGVFVVKNKKKKEDK